MTRPVPDEQRVHVLVCGFFSRLSGKQLQVQADQIALIAAQPERFDYLNPQGIADHAEAVRRVLDCYYNLNRLLVGTSGTEGGAES